MLVAILCQGCKKTLILREIPEDRVKKFLANKESLAACDVAVVVYDRLATRNSSLHLLGRCRWR